MSDHQPFKSSLEEDEEDGAKDWLVTYADMVTLLLTFFVMLIAVSETDKGRFDQVLNSIQYTLGSWNLPGGRLGRMDVHEVRRRSLATPTGTENEPLLKDLRQTFDKKNLDDTIQMEDQGDRVVMRLKGNVLFREGSAQLERSSGTLLKEIGKLLKIFDQYKIHIGGHSDNQPIKNGRITDNWELSALRAMNVLRFFIKMGINPRRMTATGYADTNPLVPNDSQANRAVNRRVEFILEKKVR